MVVLCSFDAQVLDLPIVLMNLCKNYREYSLTEV